MPRPTVSLIAIVARNGGIGLNNALLLRLPEDLAHFKRTTLGSPVVMGRKTWDSVGRKLPGRRNVVVTRNPEWAAAGAERAASLADALERLADEARIFVIGGAELYAQALPLADELVLTEIDADLEADTYFPSWDRAQFEPTDRRAHTGPEGHRYHITTYVRKQGD